MTAPDEFGSFKKGKEPMKADDRVRRFVDLRKEVLPASVGSMTRRAFWPTSFRGVGASAGSPVR